MIDKGVLQGSDKRIDAPFIYTPRSGRVNGDPVTLIDSQDGALWYSSRMVRDEYVRQNTGKATRFKAKEGGQSDCEVKKDTTPQPSPSRRSGEEKGVNHGEQQGDGSSSSSSSSSSSNTNTSTNVEGDKSPIELTRSELWAAGKSLLSEAGMAKDYGEGAALEAIKVSIVERPADPASFIVGVCKSNAKPRGSPKKQQQNLSEKNYSEGVRADGTIDF